MNKFLSYFILFFLCFSLSTVSSKVYAQDNETLAETVVHLLSYVAMDYPGAVKDGEIINIPEYDEQIEFSQQAYDFIQEGTFLKGKQKEELLSQVQLLRKYIDEKKSAEEISQLATAINDEIVKTSGIQTAPKVWPDFENGRKLYEANCALCHGKKGDGQGPNAASLDPPPSDFHDGELMDNFSPYQAYNSIRLGVPGTSMESYSSTMNEVELWDLAFYIKSFRFQDDQSDSLALMMAFNDIFPHIELEDVATMTDNQLRSILKTKSDHPESSLTALRTLEPSDKDARNSLPTAIEGLNEALKSYNDGDKSMARTKAISAYLEGIEPVEARLRSQDAAFVIEIEEQMFNVRQVIEKDKGSEVIKEEVDKAIALIHQADEMMKENELSYWLTFIIAASIFLREGVEAFLVLAVVLALIRSAGAKKALPWLHGGWITAVIMGIAGWFLSDYIIQFGGKNREIMEGLVALFAVVILLWAGFWLHSKTSASKWQHFIKHKIGGYLQNEKMFGLAAFSFMVVFREAFEVILFLQAINFDATEETRSAIGLGVAAAVVCIAIIAYVFLKYSKMIPVRQLFKYSSWLIVLLAIILVGKGVHALQESGWISINSVSSMFRLDWLGIFPTVETLLAQIGVIVLIIIAYFISNKSAKKMEKNL